MPRFSSRIMRADRDNLSARKNRPSSLRISAISVTGALAKAEILGYFFKQDR